jgi:hypothetical protein
VRHTLVPWMLLLSACSARGLTGDDVCHDVEIAIAARIHDCTGDQEAANDAPDILDDLDCLVEGMDTEELATWSGGYYDCIGAITQVTCEDVLENQDDANWWLGQDAHCGQIYGVEAADTGGGAR